MQLQQPQPFPDFILQGVPIFAKSSENFSEEFANNQATERTEGQQRTARILSIQPNPAQSGFSVQIIPSEQETMRLSVQNAVGQSVMTATLPRQTSEYAVPTSAWTAGVYSVRLQSASGLDVRQVLVVP